MKKPEGIYFVPMISGRNQWVQCGSLKEAIKCCLWGDTIYKAKPIKVGRLDKKGKFIPIKKKK